MRRTATALTTCLLLAGLTAGCSSNEEESTVVKAAPSESASLTPSPSLSPSEETLKIGDTAEINTTDAAFTAAVLEYKDKAITGVPKMLSAGQKWAAVEVKVCNTGSKGFGVSPFVWSLAYADGARVGASGMTGGDLPQPLYPMGARVKAGDCVRGNIAFQVPKERPSREGAVQPAHIGRAGGVARAQELMCS